MRFLVTIIRRGYGKTVPFQGHRVQRVTIGVAALYRGWAVVKVTPMPANRRHPGLNPTAVARTLHGLGISPRIQAIPHDLQVRLIPDRAEID